MLPSNASGSLVFVCLGGVMLCSGLGLAIFSSAIFNQIIAKSVQLTPEGSSFLMWRETPIPMTIDFYLFNWTNSEDIHKQGVKPKFQELGPYRFTEVKGKTDVVWNANNTISFKQQKRWYFDPHNSNGSLDDDVTTINIVALTAAYVSRDWHYLLRLPLRQLLKSRSVAITHTVGEFLFDGFDDPLIQMGKLGSVIAKGVQMPFDKFGWFYKRNGSSDFDGAFNMATGVDDITQLGELRRWQHTSRTAFYPGTCGDVRGSAGELFPPARQRNDSIEIYSPDMCRSLKFDYADEIRIEEINGYRYTAGVKSLDNGRLEPENSCYCVGECVPSGVVNISTCRYGAPAFVSYPHFYLADPFYTDSVEGMQPDKDKHRFYISLEPTTGIPLDVAARFQINILMQPHPDITTFANLPKVFFPMLWFQQRVTLTGQMAGVIKHLLMLSPLSVALGVVLITTGLVCLTGVAFVYWYKGQCTPDKKQEAKATNVEATSLMLEKKNLCVMPSSREYFDESFANGSGDNALAAAAKAKLASLQHDS